MILARIVAPHFVAGIVVRGDHVIECAPIVHYMRGWHVSRVDAYVKRKGWGISRVP